MIENIFEQHDQYNLMIPCHYAFSFSDNPEKCRMNFQVTKKDFLINLFKYDTFLKVSVQTNKWKIVRVIIPENIVVFINNDNSIDLILPFIDDSINFKRFLFSLAESGLIVPEVSQNGNDNDFLFISKPSFIPTSSYSYSTKINTLNQIRNVTQSQILFISEKEIIPFNDQFVDMVLPFEILETNKQIDEIGLKTHIKIWGKMKGNQCSDILEAFISKISIEDYSDSSIEELIHLCQSNDESNPELKKNLIDIDKDKERMIKDNKSKKWSPNLCSICALVCKAHVLISGIKFVQGQFEVVKRIALLMNGESFLPDDEEGLPDNFKKMFNYNENAGIEKNLTFFKYLLAFYEFIFYKIEKKEYSISIRTYVDKISEDIMSIFKHFLPKVAPFFIVHKIKNFFFYNSCYATIFCDSITNIWPIWIMLKKMHDQDKAYISLAASILYLSLPTLLEKKVRNEEQLRENNPLLFDLDDKVEDIVKVSSYLYRFKDVDIPDS